MNLRIICDAIHNALANNNYFIVLFTLFSITLIYIFLIMLPVLATIYFDSMVPMLAYPILSLSWIYYLVKSGYQSK